MKKKHLKAAVSFCCRNCQKPFQYEMALHLHEEHCGKEKAKPFKCTFADCGKWFSRKSTLNHHQQHTHLSQLGGGKKRKIEEEESETNFKKIKLPEKVDGVPPTDKEVSSMKGAKVDAFFYPKTEPQTMDQQVFFKETLPRLEADLQKVLKEKKGVKWNLMYHCTLTMLDKYRTEPMINNYYFRTPHPITSTYLQQLREQLNMAMETVEERMTIFMQAGSGWTLQQNHALVLEMVDYQPLGGGSYIELPKDVYDTKSIINIKNQDQECFKWSVLAALHPAVKNAERITHYQPYKEELNFNGIDFPVTIDQIPKFEKQNPGISVTVIGIDEPEKKKKGVVLPSVLFPLRVPNQQLEKHVVLLYWEQNEQYHYAWVKNVNRLLSRTKSHHSQTYFCERCFQGFIRSDLLEKHSEICCHIPIQAVQVVDEEISFKNWAKTEESLFRIYGDFECLLQECDEGDVNDKTVKVQKHVSCSVAWVLISNHPEVESRSFLYRPSPNPEMSLEESSQLVVEQLMESLQAIEKELLPYQLEVKPMMMTEEQEADFQTATHCYTCEELFYEEEENWGKVRDHNHATGEYRGAEHFSCNLNKRRTTHIPVFFHNLRGYDSHLIMQGIHRYAEKKKIKVIPNNMEKYVSFQLGNLRFLDSLQFLGPGASLDVLAGNLKEFPLLKEQFDKVWSFKNPQDMLLLCQKGVYPYSHIKNFEVFEETSLPQKEAFKNDLTGDDLPEEKYVFAQQVWKTTGCQTLGDFHDLYLYQDIFLLADIFEQFRQVCLKNYQLDPAHYYTVPGLAWDAALKFTKIKLETLYDIEMHQFLENGMRGGISMITHRFAQANNKYLKDYNPEQPSSFITYQDANNLYGLAMIQSLPVSDFKWMNEKDIESFDVMTVQDDVKVGYILEVDLEYPEELHDLHSDYPLAPEKMLISHEMLSPYQQQLKEDLGYKPAKVKKLLPNLWNKVKYVIHYRNLKQYLSVGMKLSKIHRVLQFRQEAGMKPYIEFNTQLRAQASNDFEKDFFKLLNNSVFGKTMEDVRRRIDIKLVTKPSIFKKHAAKVTYKRSVVFTNDEDKEEYFVGVEVKRTSIKLDKPIYTGFTVLELSKLHMYDFHYNHMMEKYGPERAKLLFTDTDSLTYHITAEDLYQDMKEDQHLYDTCNYPKDHFLFSENNKKVIGKFKDETGGLPIAEWIGLRAKMYSMMTDDGKEKKTGKGIKKSVLKKDIKHQDFKDCLMEKREFQHSMMNFRSQQHQVFTLKQTKKSLSPFDDKRYILSDGYTTRAHGHHQNGVVRPSQTPAKEKEKEEPSEEKLADSMRALSLASTNNTSLSKVDTIMECHGNQSSIDLPLAPPTSNKFHAYLASFWK